MDLVKQGTTVFSIKIAYAECEKILAFITQLT